MAKTLDGVHVLRVEDNADAAEVMKMVMEYQGGLVITAADAKTTALGILRGLRPDVLVTDVGLPDQDGITLVREARQLGLLNGAPVLAVTALDLSSDAMKAAGFDAYLRKPVEPNRLCGTVQSLAAQHRQKPG